MTVTSNSPSYNSTDLARSREQHNFVTCSFTSRVKGNFLALCTSSTSSTRERIGSNLLSVPFAAGSLGSLQLLAELQCP
jgi:hypothetical protein